MALPDYSRLSRRRSHLAETVVICLRPRGGVDFIHLGLKLGPLWILHGPAAFFPRPSAPQSPSARADRRAHQDRSANTQKPCPPKHAASSSRGQLPPGQVSSGWRTDIGPVGAPCATKARRGRAGMGASGMQQGGAKGELHYILRKSGAPKRFCANAVTRDPLFLTSEGFFALYRLPGSCSGGKVPCPCSTNRVT
jgi:hypothetical protein